jgi:hypothetical protein
MALTEAINEEYGALNTYQAVIAEFGSITRSAGSPARSSST